MANVSNNPTTGQGGGAGTEGDQTSTSQAAPMVSSAILWWALGFIVSLGILWVIVRVVSGAWHIGGK